MNQSRPHFWNITFTGTRKGMTPEQRATLVKLLNDYRPEVLLNGAARGSDQECLEVLVKMKLPIRVEVFPASIETRDEARTILKSYGPPVSWHPIFSPMHRNKLMVEVSDLVIATPVGDTEESQGGTWGTIRLAAKYRVRTVVIWPSGAVHAGYKPARAAR